MPEFVHLHTHTEYSLLDGAAKVKDLIKKASGLGMSHVAITDHGNMYGVPEFVLEARANKIKPIVGCELYIAPGSAKDKNKEEKYYHQIAWAKNATGYKNLVKLCSYGWTEGYYYKPRIDKAFLREHREGLIASTCCLAGEVNQTLLNKGEDAAETMLRDYLDIFGPENYFIEIHRHSLRDMEKCNEWLIRMSRKYNLPMIATNDVHYVNQEDSEAHDLLLALQTQSEYTDPNRFRFVDDNRRLNPRFYFKTKEEMLESFQDHPEALDNTVMLAERCEFEMNLTGTMILPQYKVPEQYPNMDAYLAVMVWERAAKRYKEITDAVRERIELELRIIAEMGYAGYFLIVQSFTTEARNRGVYVGPGRGSAAGSVVAYVLGIIDIDPLQYDLLFERFLNPERVSPPDIDIDFDDEGRQAVIDFVVEEYGRKSVAQIITYGTMGAKTALRDVGRTLGVPLSEVNRIAKMIPERPGITFKSALEKDNNPDFAAELEKLYQSPDESIRKMMQYATALEGTTRHTGVHACAVIIAPGDVTDFVPVSVAKGEVMITQFEGPKAEMCGLLKMDFLGLRTLSILKTAIQLVKENHGIEINPDEIGMEDTATYELYQRGDTVATFQFESDGMRKYLRQLKPTNIEDLIAMNALYRPGPMDNIPSFISRKHGKEEIDYFHPMLEPILKNTYGIMVYQEQIMQVAQVMAGYTLGGADILRRAMGKKKLEEMVKQREKFVTGATGNGVDKELAERVFDLMERFASYGFNKSHSAAYSVLAYKTAYIKAHFPAEYMASVLTHNTGDIKDITFFIEECRRMGITVLPPDINESKRLFSVNQSGQIRFGMEAIKGVGGGVVEEIIKERAEGGPFRSVYDLCKRLPPRSLNRRVLESLTYAGAFDSFGIERYRYFLQASNKEEAGVLDKALSYGSKVQQEKNSVQISLFGGGGQGNSDVQEPTIPLGTTQDGQIVESWSSLEQLKFEKEVIGFYLSSHPLDNYSWQMKAFATCTLSELEEMKDKEVSFGGIVTDVKEKMSKKGNKYLVFTLEDLNNSREISLFGEQYNQFRQFVELDDTLWIKAKYQPRYSDPSEYELRILDIQPMSDAFFNNKIKHLCLEFSADELDDAVIDSVYELLQTYKGDKALKFRIKDPKFNAEIPLVSTNLRVLPANELIHALTESGITWSVA